MSHTKGRLRLLPAPRHLRCHLHIPFLCSAFVCKKRPVSIRKSRARPILVEAPMKFTDLLSDAHIVVADAPADKTAAIALLVNTLHDRGMLVRPQDALSLVLEREAEYPTGIGCGVAIPHANTWATEEPFVALGIFRSGLDFGAPDGQAATVLVLLLTATGMTSTHLKLLARISRLAKHGLAERVAGLSESAAILHALENCEHDFLDI